MNKREVERLAALPLSERMVLSEADAVKLAKLLLKAWNDLKNATEQLDSLKDELYNYQCENDLNG